MEVLQDEIVVTTGGRGSFEVTDRVAEFVRGSGLVAGSLHLFLRHTSASLLVTEDADPQVRADLESWFGELAPDGHPTFRHVDEGPDDMPAHARTLLAGHSLLLPVSGRELMLGRWQGVYLWEHRTAPHRRHLFMTLQGEFAPPR
ncbi:hypothetical protein Pla163_15750 [Planctomycetes bacterium Pla163]|uniref:Secondary thiamine-phosphate synthase enzyme n=1 Tax=Rohdeia mirabilis TaxID=2528008 RepID=A0A518CZ52_9BACT|nr:hypothetical protein Pla163_15750 [Planctomycetes bacterium Pla163]